MEVLQSEVKQANWDEWNRLKANQVCAECGGELDVRTVPERKSLVFGCAAHPTAGFRQRTSYTEEFRRGKDVHPTIRNNIEAKMMVKTELDRAINLLALRFPNSIKDIAGAALFINDCLRLGLDPLIQPAEAVPIAFKTKDKAGKEKWTVAMIITEDGWLSMAARGCPDEYDGSPATMPLLDYLMREHEKRPLVELEVLAKRIAKNLCDDAEAFVWVALGKRRSATSINPVYGYYKQKEWEEDKRDKLPAASQPGNQARVRAVKHWVRETYPECRQKMLEYTADILRRSEGAIEAQKWIDAEYHFIIDTTDKKPALTSPPGGQKAVGAPNTARTKRAKKDENKAHEPAQRSPDQCGGQGGDKSKAAPSGADERALSSSSQSSEMAGAREAPDAVTADGVRVNMIEVREKLKIIRWPDETARSWFKQFGIDDSGTLSQVIGRATRVQVEKFIKEIQNRADSVQPKLFK